MSDKFQATEAQAKEKIQKAIELANTDRYKKVKISDASTPINGICMIYTNRYWIVTPDDEILFYRPSKNSSGSPQCNDNGEIASSLRDKLYPGFHVVQLPVVFQKVDPREYVF